ncbi:MAG TPA: hypothetical protein DDZ51_22495 [Planctomycetaceae bacterium]|nr:hypothetical protein [Planctomycetaceae bacterium]
MRERPLIYRPALQAVLAPPPRIKLCQNADSTRFKQDKVIRLDKDRDLRRVAKQTKSNIASGAEAAPSLVESGSLPSSTDTPKHTSN